MTSQTPATSPVIDIKNNRWDFNAKARTYTRTAGKREFVITWLTGSSFPFVLEEAVLSTATQPARRHVIDRADFETFDAAATYAHIAAR